LTTYRAIAFASPILVKIRHFFSLLIQELSQTKTVPLQIHALEISITADQGIDLPE
jgi:hypothetical protein